MANLKTLKPPKKGEPSRNPNGRPKGSQNRATIAKKYLAMIAVIPPTEHKKLATAFPKLKDKISAEELITLAQISKASKGDTNAYKALMDSVYGQPKQQIEFDGNIVPGEIEL